VASEECIPVEGIGDVKIPTSHGSLYLSNVLLCKRVRETVLSVGFFEKWDGSVGFRNGRFVFSLHTPITIDGLSLPRVLVSLLPIVLFLPLLMFPLSRHNFGMRVWVI
jgi:hypothetical protein